MSHHLYVSVVKCNNYSKRVDLLNVGEFNGSVKSKCSKRKSSRVITLIIIRQQTMTKKMLVKTESVDMTWGRVLGSDG